MSQEGSPCIRREFFHRLIWRKVDGPLSRRLAGEGGRDDGFWGAEIVESENQVRDVILAKLAKDANGLGGRTLTMNPLSLCMQWLLVWLLESAWLAAAAVAGLIPGRWRRPPERGTVIGRAIFDCAADLAMAEASLYVDIADLFRILPSR